MEPEQTVPIDEKLVEQNISITKAGKERQVRVRILPIVWLGKREEVIIKKLTYGERADYTEKFVKIKMQGEFQSTELDMKAMQVQALIMCIHKAPFPVTEDYIQNELDGELGEELYTACEDFNKLTKVKKKTSAGPISTAPTTQR